MIVNRFPSLALPQNKYQLVVLTVLVLLIKSSIMSCRPSDGSHNRNKTDDDESLEYTDLTPMEVEGIQKCQADEDKMELCMRCVKATKAKNVYPMCCLNEDGVGDWCREFVYFGIQ